MQKEQLSAYIDGEQSDHKMIDALHQSEELQHAWDYYHLIRSVMRQESRVILGSEFTAKIADLIEHEENVNLVNQPSVQLSRWHWLKGLQKYGMPITQLAIAASVCFVSVFSVQSWISHQSELTLAQEPSLKTLPFTPSVQEVSYNAPWQEITTSEQLERQNKRLGMMLQDYELQRRISLESSPLEWGVPYNASTVAE